MTAVVAHQYGGAEVLKHEKVPIPEPKENEALVRVIAAGVNPADPLIVSGKYAKEFGTRLPLTPGYDIAGVAEKTGARVATLKAGDAVYGYPLMGGGWAEYAVVTEAEAAAKPGSLTYAEAAAVPLAALTAWQSLISTARLEAGQTVLVHGGSGGVGSFAVQIAKARGAKVIATASTPNQDLLRQLGADVALDYTSAKFEEVAREVDVVLDPVGKDTLARSYAVVDLFLFDQLRNLSEVNRIRFHRHRNAANCRTSPAALDQAARKTDDDAALSQLSRRLLRRNPGRRLWPRRRPITRAARWSSRWRMS